MSGLLQLLQLLKSLGGGNFAKIVPLLLSLFKAVKAGDVATAADVVMQIIALWAPTPAPTPGPIVFSAAPSSSKTDEALFVSEAVAAGCDKADAEALVAELK